MDSPKAFRSTPIDLGHGISVELRFADGRMDAIWSPRIPRGRHARRVLPAYRRARLTFLRRVAEKLGTAILVAEIGPNREGSNG